MIYNLIYYSNLPPENILSTSSSSIEEVPMLNQEIEQDNTVC